MALLTPQDAIQRLEEAEAEHRKILDIKRYIHHSRKELNSMFGIISLISVSTVVWTGYLQNWGALFCCGLLTFIFFSSLMFVIGDNEHFDLWVRAQEREGVTISDIEQERIREKLQIKK
jgi:hypothetical protein